ncbi:hypothetical protein QTP88_009451 [Uroleucon formosanum]
MRPPRDPLTTCFVCYHQNVVTSINVFENIKRLCSNLNFKFCSVEIYSDFEKSILNSASNIWPDIKLSTCRFHLGQCRYRKIQSLELTNMYKYNSPEGKWLQYCFGLPFLHPQEVSDCFLELMSEIPAEKKIQSFADYLVEHFVSEDSLFSPELWAKDSGIASYVEVAKNIAIELDLETYFPEKCMVSELAEDEGHSISINSKREFEGEFNAVMGSVIVQMEWRYKKMEEVSSDFEFSSGHFLYYQPDDIIKKYASDLAMKYSKYLDGTELVSEILCFKHQALSLFSDLNTASPLDLINVIHSNF